VNPTSMTYYLQVARPGTSRLTYLEDSDGFRHVTTTRRQDRARFGSLEGARLVGDRLFQAGWYVVVKGDEPPRRYVPVVNIGGGWVRAETLKPGTLERVCYATASGAILHTGCKYAWPSQLEGYAERACNAGLNGEEL
jgi:hypothetical protein